MGTSRKPHSVRVRHGDQVRVIAGADRGKDGRVLRVLPKKEQVVVEGVNLVYRHVRRSQKNPQGGRVRREAPIHMSNVMVIDPDLNVPTKLGKRPDEASPTGWTRFARKSKSSLDQLPSKGGKGGKKDKKAKE